jgi:hypothetical protein
LPSQQSGAQLPFRTHAFSCSQKTRAVNLNSSVQMQIHTLRTVKFMTGYQKSMGNSCRSISFFLWTEPCQSAIAHCIVYRLVRFYQGLTVQFHY